MNKKIIILNVILGICFIIATIAFVFITQLNALWTELESRALWTPGADYNQVEALYNQFKLLTVAQAFIAIVALANLATLILIDISAIKSLRKSKN